MDQQAILVVHTTPEAGKVAVGADDAVTRDHNGDRVLVIGQTHRTARPRFFQGAGDVAIASAAAIGYLAKLVPDRLLERRATGFEGN